MNEYSGGDAQKAGLAANSNTADAIYTALRPHVPNKAGLLSCNFGGNTAIATVNLTMALKPTQENIGMEFIPDGFGGPVFGCSIDRNGDNQFEQFKGEKLPKFFVGSDGHVYLVGVHYYFSRSGQGARVEIIEDLTREHAQYEDTNLSPRELLERATGDRFQDSPIPFVEKSFEPTHDNVYVSLNVVSVSDDDYEYVADYLSLITDGALPPQSADAV